MSSCRSISLLCFTIISANSLMEIGVISDISFQIFYIKRRIHVDDLALIIIDF